MTGMCKIYIIKKGAKFCAQNKKATLKHFHKKRKDSLETRAILLIFFLELTISGVAVQGIHENSGKWPLLLGTAQ